MERKVMKKSWECKNCHRLKKKKEFIKRTVSWNSIYICSSCWYYNWESIFTEYKQIKKQELIFWQPIKWKQ